MTEPSAPREFSGARLATAGLTGGALAAALNVVTFFAAKAAGVTLVARFDPSAPASGLPFAMVVVASMVPAIAATGLLALMNRFVARPGRVFAGLAAAFTLLSMGGPATLADADGGTKAVLALMHLFAAGAITWALVGRGSRPS